jgi:hypothetical protein
MYIGVWGTYGSILGSFRAAALECDAVALVLETLRSNQTLDLGSLGVGLGTLLLGLNLTADDELADLNLHSVSNLVLDLRLSRPLLARVGQRLAKKL